MEFAWEYRSDWVFARPIAASGVAAAEFSAIDCECYLMCWTGYPVQRVRTPCEPPVRKGQKSQSIAGHTWSLGRSSDRTLPRLKGRPNHNSERSDRSEPAETFHTYSRMESRRFRRRGETYSSQSRD